MNKRAVLCLLLLCALSGCGGGQEKVEEWVGDGWRELAVDAYEIEGKRAGDQTRATAVFLLAGRKKLKVDLTVSYDPTPVLADGNWSLGGLSPLSNSVKALSLKFTGGQGEGPSLGGRFVLVGDGQERFRIELPMRPIEKPKW